MRAPSPRSGETDMSIGDATVPAWPPPVADEKSNDALKFVCSVPVGYPPVSAPGSPAAFTVGFENVWSPNEPLVVASEMRRLCVPNSGGAPAKPLSLTTPWSNDPVLVQPS